jgi:hypothetical protein
MQAIVRIFGALGSSAAGDAEATGATMLSAATPAARQTRIADETPLLPARALRRGSTREDLEEFH